MNTFLLYWNPHFSSYKVERFLDEFDFEEERDLLTEDDWGLPEDFNWSIFEHEKAHAGDRFFFVRVGQEKPTGMIGAGYFTSEPYEDEDWSGQGRKVFYMDLQFEEIIKPDSDRILSTEALAAAIPEIDWTTGHAGVMVSEEVAEKIEALWKEHIESIW